MNFLIFSCLILIHIDASIQSLNENENFQKYSSKWLADTEATENPVTADGPSLIIKPGDGTQLKELDDRYVFVCIIPPNNNDAVSNFQWLDPRNQTIDENYSTNRDPKIHMRVGAPNERLLEFEKLSQQQIGTYTCVANVGGRTMNAVMNIVPLRKIKFVDVPTYQVAAVGSKYKIKCEVQADPPPRVEWTRNNERLSTSQNYILEPDGLVINGVRESDEGEYNCEVLVLNTGEVKNRNIHLEVAPRIINTPEFQFITEGEKATIVCQATGKPKPEIRWIKRDTHEVVSKGIDGILYIEKVAKENRTEYICEAKNEAGEARTTVHLSVKSKPDVIDVRNGTAKVGNFAQVQCIVYANPKPSVIIKKYTLRRDRRDVNNQARSVVAVQARTAVEIIDDPTRRHHVVIATMNFTSVERYDDGMYECIAENDVGRSVRSVHLTVETPPVFDDKLNIKEIFGWGSREVNLTCVADAIPNATIAWFLNNKLIHRNDQVYTIFGNGSLSTLQIKPLDKSVYGSYKCKADNKHGTANHNIDFKEVFPPAPPGGTYDFNITTATSVTIRIPEPLNTAGLRIKGYLVQYKKDIDTWNEAANETWPYGAAYVIRNLNPSTRYEFRMAAFNEVGYSGYSDTKGLLIPAAPSVPSVVAPLETDKTLELRWKIPSSNGAEIDKYELKYCVVHENTDQPDGFDRPQDDASCKSRDLMNNEVFISYTIPDLSPDTYYRVELKAHNNIGSSKPSSRVFRTNGQKEIISSSQNNSKTCNEPILVPYGWKNDSHIIELAIVVDNSLFNALQNSTKAVKEQVQNQTNYLNFVFQKLNVFIALVHLEIWSDGDKIEVSEDCLKTYYNFQSYAENLMKNEHIDNVQFISGKIFDNDSSATKLRMGTHAFGTIPGKNPHHFTSAFANLMGIDINDCKPANSEKRYLDVSWCHDAYYLTRTIGYNLGIVTNDCLPTNCNTNNPYIRSVDFTWCPCIFEQMDSLMKNNSENFKHLKDKPIKLFDGPVCGNGFLEQGEECDCGIPQNCGNSSCCDAKSCRIIPNIPCRMRQ